MTSRKEILLRVLKVTDELVRLARECRESNVCTGLAYTLDAEARSLQSGLLMQEGVTIAVDS